MLLRKFKKKALKLVDEDFRVLDFSFGLPYTYVLIEGRRGKALGVAMTLPEEVQRYENSIEEPSLEAFIEKADSLNIIERAFGLAAINAVSQYHIDLSDAKWIDAVELLDESIEKVAVIGNMPPIVKALRERGFELYIFERNPKLWDRNTFSDALEYWLLPEVDAVMASATCILNGTIDMLLDRAKNARIFLLTGPTGQVLPEFFKGTGVTHIASMKVVNVENAILQLKLGCFRGFSNESKKYVVEP
ncbi:Hypothetical protein TON_0303 [Thermococcus onnurineus NA1]|uniref:Heavy-metal chelation domain-containing protein n=1 Tax=Thermococcus onnurineus (strain NA1) TaxID=523850 RepID=B6YTA1_THEON|nr:MULTISPECIES: DUF364 domain-containing protein [Thermococcus]ACJ15788.1 Hypothetical protein TON_0303 [Thermococcus onnurineus NA1]NJE46281.1 hypothetical protein [Thermococcus sp. GR7]NJE79231.1 hypothetical protein [Thermococcus sp. GR4]NJF23840.1 hypothetical protein [Thermococcus sp. GR5]